jgi:hypothetical protein
VSSKLPEVSIGGKLQGEPCVFIGEKIRSHTKLKKSSRITLDSKPRRNYSIPVPVLY